MDALIERSGDIVVVHLRGRVDYESVEPFRRHCVSHLSGEKVVFNLGQLQFVGSVGITDFVETMTQLSVRNANGIKFAGVGNEFRRIFEASEFRSLEIYENTDRAVKSFLGFEVPQMPRLSLAEEDSVSILDSGAVSTNG